MSEPPLPVHCYTPTRREIPWRSEGREGGWCVCVCVCVRGACMRACVRGACVIEKESVCVCFQILSIHCI